MSSLRMKRASTPSSSRGRGSLVVMNEEYEPVMVFTKNESFKRARTPTRARSSKSHRSSTAAAVPVVYDNEDDVVMTFLREASFRKHRQQRHDSSLEKFIGVRPRTPTRSRSVGRSVKSRGSTIKSRASTTRSSQVERISQAYKESREPANETTPSSWLSSWGGASDKREEPVRDEPKTSIQTKIALLQALAALKTQEESPNQRYGREDLSFVESYFNSIQDSIATSFLDDDDDDEEYDDDDISCTTAGATSVPSTVYVPHTLREKILAKGYNLRPKFMRKKKRNSSQRRPRDYHDTTPSTFEHHASSFSLASSLSSIKDVKSTKQELKKLDVKSIKSRKERKQSKLVTSVSRLNCAAGVPNDYHHSQSSTEPSTKTPYYLEQARQAAAEMERTAAPPPTAAPFCSIFEVLQPNHGSEEVEVSAEPACLCLPVNESDEMERYAVSHRDWNGSSSSSDENGYEREIRKTASRVSQGSHLSRRDQLKRRIKLMRSGSAKYML